MSRKSLPRSFVCPVCQLRSYHPKDVEEGYCVRCHVFAADVPAIEELRALTADDGPPETLSRSGFR